MPAPAPTPAKISPFASPRSDEGIQADTSLLEEGNNTASPAPNKKRVPNSNATDTAKPGGTSAVSAVNTPHQTTPAEITIRGPYRSASHPPGT